jgi:hypothetical protein
MIAWYQCIKKRPPTHVLAASKHHLKRRSHTNHHYVQNPGQTNASLRLCSLCVCYVCAALTLLPSRTWHPVMWVSAP